MGKILVIAEKPSVGKEIARVLGCRMGRDGYIEGPKYIITWSLGHLVTLADPEAYSPQYKHWALETLPMIPEHMKLVVIKDTSRQYGVVAKLLHSAEVDELVIATDAGREGELVARWIIQMAGFKKPIKRLWISSQTDRAILDGFASLKPAKEYENLFHSAVCRAEADWLVGLNVTRALTCKYNAQLSAGRVQTPTLSIIVARENEINSFVPVAYNTITARLDGFLATWKDGNGQARIFDESKAKSIVEKLGRKAKVAELKKAKKTTPPPLLYDLTELQRDANKRYGFSAKKTLSVMQSLYETHKALTYPRTDSRYLTDDVAKTIPERLAKLPAPYAGMAKKLTPQAARLVNNSKVTDHHAIIPTEQPVAPGSLTSDEKFIYDLVVRRFLAGLSENMEYEQTTVTLDISGEIFTARGKIILKKGWQAFYEGSGMDDYDGDDEEDTEESQGDILPAMKQGDILDVLSVNLKPGKTKPPARYTEATLLSAMEHPGKFIENKAMREVMESSRGLGTPATRAEIIERLFSAFYVERRGKDIVPTSKGIQLVSIVPSELASPELTAKWEEQLTAISKGKASPKDFTRSMREYAKKLVGNVIASEKTYRHDNKTTTRCPVCDKFLLEVTGKKGKLLVCEDRECGYRENLTLQTNARCPQCHKKLELFGEGEKRMYICQCGFREKYAMFNKRFEETKNSMNKRELEKYMKEQRAEAATYNPLAEAIAKAQAEKKKK